jgi:hypothetical protein
LVMASARGRESTVARPVPGAEGWADAGSEASIRESGRRKVRFRMAQYFGPEMTRGGAAGALVGLVEGSAGGCRAGRAVALAGAGLGSLPRGATLEGGEALGRGAEPVALTLALGDAAVVLGVALVGAGALASSSGTFGGAASTVVAVRGAAAVAASVALAVAVALSMASPVSLLLPPAQNATAAVTTTIADAARLTQSWRRALLCGCTRARVEVLGCPEAGPFALESPAAAGVFQTSPRATRSAVVLEGR